MVHFCETSSIKLKDYISITFWSLWWCIMKRKLSKNCNCFNLILFNFMSHRLLGLFAKQCKIKTEKRDIVSCAKVQR